MTQNVYIHIPFCKQKCKYCSFVSFPKIELKEEYLAAITKEIKAKYKGEILETLYFGGGTPSLLEAGDFEKLINLFHINKNTEITAELNPENLDLKYLEEIFSVGINRISIGCQTFDNNILKNIGRRHSGEQVIDAVNRAKEVGFKNISLDFIYGLPAQTNEMFANDLNLAVNLGIQHISLYGLKIDEGCFFYQNRPERLPDEDLQADMYLDAINVLTQKGFNHYEISNFSLSGFESKHNINYWKNNSYYGFGLAAHGYLDNVRYSNHTSFDEYFKNPVLPKVSLILTDSEKLEEEIFLGFRLKSGINTKIINNKYSIDFEKKYRFILDKYLLSQYLEKTADGYKLTKSGILISNYLLADFLD